MTFLLDNDVPEELSYLLEHLGHHVRRVRQVLPREASDAAVLDYASRSELILITCNPATATTSSGSRASDLTAGSSW